MQTAIQINGNKKWFETGSCQLGKISGRSDRLTWILITEMAEVYTTRGRCSTDHLESQATVQFMHIFGSKQ